MYKRQVYTALIQWNQSREVHIPAAGMTSEEYCLHLWLMMFEDERKEFIKAMSDEYIEWAQDLDRREAHWEEVNEAILSHEEHNWEE